MTTMDCDGTGWGSLIDGQLLSYYVAVFGTGEIKGWLTNKQSWIAADRGKYKILESKSLLRLFAIWYVKD